MNSTTKNFSELAHRLNAFICPPLGFVLNILFIHFVLKKTPKEMVVHSRILLQTSILDIISLTMLTIGAPFYQHANGKYCLFYEGYLANLLKQFYAITEITPILHYMLFIFIFFFQSFSICTQFLYRYLLLNCNITVNLRRYLFLLFFPFLAALTLISFSWYGVTGGVLIPTYNNDVAIQFEYITNAFRTIFPYLFAFCSILSTVIITFCGIKMVRFVNGHVHFNAKMKMLNRQLTWTLIIIAILPISMQIIEVLFVFHGIYIIVTNAIPNIDAFLNLFEYWPPILNPLITILTNKPYRDTLLKMFRKVKIGSIVVGPANMQI